VNLVASDVAFGYPGHAVFEHLDFRVSRGMRIGVVGENGTGKSTLLALLAGSLQPSKGSIKRKGSLAIVEQELDTVPGQTIGDLVQSALREVRQVAAELEAAAERLQSESSGCKTENNAVILRQGADATQNAESRAEIDAENEQLANLLARAEQLRSWDADRRLDEALTRLGAPRDLERPMATLSVGERYRVRLACRLAESADFLLLDEPTNHLDQAAIEYLTAQLLRWPGGVVLVTHDRELLDDVATAIFDLNPSIDCRPVLYGKPGYESYRRAKDAALRRWRSRYVREQKRLAELALTLDSSYEGLSDEWRPPKGSQKHRRGTRARQHVKAADRQILQLGATAVDIPEPPLELNFPALPTVDLPATTPLKPQAPALISVNEPLVLGDAGKARLDLTGQVINIEPGGRLLVVGPNGSGKSTLLKVLGGQLKLNGGTRAAISNIRYGIVGQENAKLVTAGIDEAKITGFEAIQNEVLELLSRGQLDPDNLNPVLDLGLLTEAELDKPLKDLSAGQRRRFELARVLVTAPQLLILDEPTNHLSIDLVDTLTKALDKTEAAVIIATHDRRMRQDLADWPTLELE